MTCIVGLKTDEAIYIGGDGRVSRGHGSILRDGAVKIFESDGIVFGASGAVRNAQIIQYGMHVPRYHPEDDVFGYVTINLTSAMRKALKENDALRTDDDGEKYMGVWFVVACQGRLFEISTWGSVLEPPTGEVALGSGSDIALGSLESTRHSDLPPEQRVLHAIVAAERHNAGVGDSITLATIPLVGDDREVTMTTIAELEEVRPGETEADDDSEGDSKS